MSDLGQMPEYQKARVGSGAPYNTARTLYMVALPFERRRFLEPDALVAASSSSSSKITVGESSHEASASSPPHCPPRPRRRRCPRPCQSSPPPWSHPLGVVVLLFAGSRLSTRRCQASAPRAQTPLCEQLFTRFTRWLRRRDGCSASDKVSTGHPWKSF